MEGGKLEVAQPTPLPNKQMVRDLRARSFVARARQRYDILALAFQTDSTRVSTFVVAHDGSYAGCCCEMQCNVPRPQMR